MVAPLQEWLATAYRGDEPPATESQLRNIESQIGLRLPDPVRFVMTTLYRPEGFVGESYIAFFTLDDLAQSWRDAQGGARGFIPFASNGAGEWYGIDSRLESPAFVLMPSIGTEWGAAMLLGATWDEFWETLKRGNLFDQVYQPPQK
jgi:SMI1 / KNR4 family (SUKH-1)